MTIARKRREVEIPIVASIEEVGDVIRVTGVRLAEGAPVTELNQRLVFEVIYALAHGGPIGETDPDDVDDETAARCETLARSVRQSFASEAAIAAEIDRGMG